LADQVLLKIVCLLMRWLFSLAVLVVRGDGKKNAELRVLRHENAVLRRNAGRVRYEPGDRGGFVDAALIASHTSTPISWPNIAGSFSSAIFTCRKVLSIRLASSATHGEDTGTVRSTISW
jgi:hypothetical protein